MFNNLFHTLSLLICIILLNVKSNSYWFSYNQTVYVGDGDWLGAIVGASVQ